MTSKYKKLLLISLGIIFAALALGAASIILFSPRIGKIATEVQKVAADVDVDMAFRIGQARKSVLNDSECTLLTKALGDECWYYAEKNTVGASLQLYLYGRADKHIVNEYHFVVYESGLISINGKYYDCGNSNFYNALKDLSEDYQH